MLANPKDTKDYPEAERLDAATDFPAGVQRITTNTPAIGEADNFVLKFRKPTR